MEVCVRTELGFRNLRTCWGRTCTRKTLFLTKNMKRCPMVSEAVEWGMEGFLHWQSGSTQNWNVLAAAITAATDIWGWIKK